MSSLFHRRSPAQEPGTLREQQPVQHPRTADPSLGSATDLRQQGAEAARRLKLPYQRILVDVAIATLVNASDPYVPASAEEAYLASTLAHASIGLLTPNTAGFVTCYQLTPLGAATVQALLHETIAQRAAQVPWQGGTYAQW